jgi:hypothetical protein
MKLAKPRIPIDWAHTDELIGTLTKFDTSSGDLVTSGYLKKNPFPPADHAAIVMNNVQGPDPSPTKPASTSPATASRCRTSRRA